jgi:cytoskeleton protein RodZ
MSEPDRDFARGSGSAGALLREAREAMGIPVEELAAILKVVPRKIELLEADRFDEFPDPVFVRALAQSLCRSLKIDAAAVLALLPKTPHQRLDKIHVSLNAQYRDRPTQLITDDWSGVAKPLIWGPALLVLAAAVIYLFPTSWLSPAKVSPRAASTVTAANDAASAAPGASAVAASPVVATTTPTDAGVREGSSVVTMAGPTLAPAPAPAAAQLNAPSPASPVATAPATAQAAAPEAPVDKVAPQVSGVLQFRTSADSWIEVQDARGVMLLSRGLEAGEAVGLNGAMPMKVTIGNVRATQVIFRAKPMDLALFTRDNIARFELK